jgi:hypothetical protein
LDLEAEIWTASSKWIIFYTFHSYFWFWNTCIGLSFLFQFFVGFFCLASICPTFFLMLYFELFRFYVQKRREWAPKSPPRNSNRIRQRIGRTLIISFRFFAIEIDRFMEETPCKWKFIDYKFNFFFSLFLNLNLFSCWDLDKKKIVNKMKRQVNENNAIVFEVGWG